MLETAIRAARRAGEIQREHFGRVLRVDEAERFDIKLRVDKLCEEAILEILSRAFPDHAVLGEESGASGDSDHRWIVDPLDGTVNFFYGIPVFAVSIGLEVEDRPHIGVIYDPLRDELFAAERGKGATLNGNPMRVSSVSDAKEAVVAVGFMKSPATIDAALRAMERGLHHIFKVRCLGSAAIDMAYVAAGRYTAYYECAINDWDIAAGRALLLEAGGRYDERKIGPSAQNIFACNRNAYDNIREYFDLEAVGAEDSSP